MSKTEFSMTQYEFEKYIKRMEPKWSGKNAAAKEAIHYNIFAEYNAMKKMIDNGIISLDKGNDHKYKIGRFLTLKYIITCVKNDPDNGDYYDPENVSQLKKAGRLLYEADGMNGMHDGLVWSFIPKRYRREIDMAWNGIGEWKS